MNVTKEEFVERVLFDLEKRKCKKKENSKSDKSKIKQKKKMEFEIEDYFARRFNRFNEEFR